jgi:transposase
MATRKPYPSDVSDEEWTFVAPYLALVREDAPQREYDLREVLNGLRWVVRTGSPWRYMPHDLPPWEAVYQQTQRWLKAGVFEEMIHDLRVLLRLSKERTSEPTAAIVDSRTLRSTPESGSRGGYDGHKNKSPANEDDRKEVEKLSEEIQKATGENVELAYVDQGYTGEKASESAAEHGIRLEVVKHEEAKGGFVLLPRRWVVERDFAWASRFRRLVKDYERLPETLAGLHFVAFACLFLQQAAGILLTGS